MGFHYAIISKRFPAPCAGHIPTIPCQLLLIPICKGGKVTTKKPKEKLFLFSNRLMAIAKMKHSCQLQVVFARKSKPGKKNGGA